MNHTKYVGIMVSESQIGPPFSHQKFFAHLCVLGAEWGCQVYVFSPVTVDCAAKSVEGYRYLSGGWIKQIFPLPDLIYDRAFFHTKQHYQRHMSALQRLQRLKKITFLGRGLYGKWAVFKVLAQHNVISAHLPETELLRHPSQLFHWFLDKPSLVIKPESGTHGKGILVITKTASSEYHLQGRDMQNQIVAKYFPDSHSLKHWLIKFVNGRRYLLQRYLHLQTKQGVAYDIRVLMQKGSNGQWMQTGMAARLGKPTSVTSNLHGGGSAAEVMPLLTAQFDVLRANAVLSKINELSDLIPPFLEQHFGRLAELGLDIGVDPDGGIWIIEVNSKPGRTAARWFAHPDASVRAMSNPMLYARYLLHQSLNKATILGG
jgi:hypothetical protein